MVTKNKGGRPEKYSIGLVNEICELISQGNSLKKICLKKNMPSMSSVFNWIHTESGFLEKYEIAIEQRAVALGEDLLEISDSGIQVVKNGAAKKSGALAQIVRLQVDTRKWIMSKMKPKKYGEQLDVTSDHKPLPSPIYDGKSLLRRNGTKSIPIP